MAQNRTMGRMLISASVWYNMSMVKILEQAITEVEMLPETDQEQIGRRLLSHVEKLRELRGEIDKGISSLDAGEGKQLDIELFLEEMNRGHEAS
jgi:hypothetical protein